VGEVVCIEKKKQNNEEDGKIKEKKKREKRKREKERKREWGREEGEEGRNFSTTTAIKIVIMSPTWGPIKESESDRSQESYSENGAENVNRSDMSLDR